LIRPFNGRRGPIVRTAALILCTAAASCSRPAPAAQQAPIDPAGLFAQACAKCHAADGSGGLPTVANGPRPIDLTAAEWQRARSDDELRATIRGGRGAMPPFEGVLTTEQIAALGSYVRTLKRP